MRRDGGRGRCRRRCCRGGRRGRGGRRRSLLLGLVGQLEGAGRVPGLRGGGAGGVDEEHLAVVLQLLDRFADVRERPVTAVLGGDVVVDAGEPALGELLEAGDVDRAVGQPLGELGHVAIQEHPVGAHAVAGERRPARFGAVLLHIGQALCLRLLERHPAVELVEQAGDRVHVDHEGVHAGERFGRRLDDDVDAVSEDVQVGVGHEHGDLDERIALLVEAGHLAIDPDDAVVDGTGGAGSHQATVSRERSRYGRVRHEPDRGSVSGVRGAPLVSRRGTPGGMPAPRRR